MKWLVLSCLIVITCGVELNDVADDPLNRAHGRWPEYMWNKDDKHDPRYAVNISDNGWSSIKIRYTPAPKADKRVYKINYLVHIDKSLALKLASYNLSSSRDVILHVKKIFKNVEKVFREPKLNVNLILKVKAVKFLRNDHIKNSTIFTTPYATAYLKSYCNWQATKKTKHHFYSVLLTGLDLYYIDKEGYKVWRCTVLKLPENRCQMCIFIMKSNSCQCRMYDIPSEILVATLSRTYRSGVCAKHKSCSILEWNPARINHWLAHEIGHSLGINHDGYPNNVCAPTDYIMAHKYKETRKRFQWSWCSRFDLDAFLGSRTSSCMKQLHRRRPNIDDY